MLLICGVGEDSWESLGLQEIQPVHLKGDQSWVFIGRTAVEAETPILWPPDAKSWLILKDLDAGKRLKAGGEGDNREWDGWMASPTRCTCFRACSRNWWRTGKPGMLQAMGSQRVEHDWATSLSLFTFMHWRRKWQPTPVVLPGESQGQGKPGGLPSMGSHRVGHDWSDLAIAKKKKW